MKFEIDDDGVVQTEVLLPKLESQHLSFSIEVVAIWQKNDLAEQNQNSFFTDSNSIELVERKVIPDKKKLIPELTFPV